MRKRVFGSIFLTALVTLLLTASLLLAAVHSGLSGNARERLAGECGYIARIAERGDRAALEEIGQSYTDRITLVSADGAVLYDNQGDEDSMENHRERPEIEQALRDGVGASSLSLIHISAAKRRQIGEIKEFLAENGANGTLMSGSGPTVYGLFSDEGRAKTAAKMLGRRFADTFLTETV